MKKAVIIAIAAVVVVGGAGAAYAFTQKSDDTANSQTQTNQTTNSQEQVAEPTSVKATLASFLTSNDTKECTYSANVNDSQTTGTVYFSNQRMRMNYTSTSAEETQSGSMIVMSGTQYVWDTTSKQGFKFAFTADAAAAESSSQTQSVDVNQAYDFTCKNWTVNESYFTPPTDVTFQDLSQLQNQLQ